ncbi:MAG: TonB-dependent receptor [Bacteroidales bacterium]|nr:TonB-dependent receptor [Bacteroidales bacterium]
MKYNMPSSESRSFLWSKTVMFFLFAFLYSGMTLAQQGTIRGRVYDEQTNEGLPFVNLIIEGTTTGSTTDFDGNFLFTGVSPGFVRLRVSAVGYETRLSPEIMVTATRTANIDIGLRERPIDLDVVEVRVSQFERRDESPLSLRRLGIQEIERSPGSNRDISRVIQGLPGVAATPAFRNDVIVRGGGPAENSFFLDGVEIPNINHFATQGASGGPVGIINTDFIREVEMYSGAFPANRGNAMSSVFEFRQINGNPDKLNFQATVGASDLALTADGPVTENTTFIASARRSYLQFLFGLVGLPFLPTYNGFQFKTNTRISNDASLSIIGIGAVDNSVLNLDANETEEQRYILDFLPENEQWNYALGAVYRRFRENGTENWVLSRNMLRNIAYKYPGNDFDLARILDYSSDEIENKFRYERSFKAGDYQLNLGSGGEYARYRNNTFQQVFFNNMPDTINYFSEFDMFKWSLFGQVSRRFIDERLTLSLGVRSDANNYSPQMSNLLDQLSPRLSASYALRDNLFLNFNTGRYYQLPAYTTMGFRNNDGVLVNRENRLTYISVDHIVAGIELQPSAINRFTLEGFYKHYNNYPFSLRDSVALGSRSADFGVVGGEEVRSIAEGRAYGAEVFYRNQDLLNWNVILSYTYVRSEFQNLSGDYIPSAWDNRHILNLTGLRKLPRNWEFGFKWRYSGGSPFTPYDLELSAITSAWDAQGMGYLDYSRYNSRRTPDFHNLDIRIDKQFYLSNFSLMVYLDVQNVYNFKSRVAPYLVRNLDENGNPVVFEGQDGVMRYELRQLENEIGSILPSIGIIIII